MCVCVCVFSAAARGGAIIADCGLKTGLARGHIEKQFQRGKNVCRLGISPNFIAEPLDPLFHQHIIYTNYQGWHDSDKLAKYVQDKFNFLESLAGPCPIVCVLANSGHVAWLETRNACARDWPVICLEGSGLLADEMCTFMANKTCSHRDYYMRQVYHSQQLSVFPESGTPMELAQVIHTHLMIRVKPLKNKSAFWWKKDLVVESDSGESMMEEEIYGHLYGDNADSFFDESLVRE